MDVDQSSNRTEQIWRELSDRLHQFILSRVSSSADADDILQNVFLHIHQKLNSLRSTKRLESWVFQITRNAIVDHFRKSRLSESPGTEIADENSEIENANAEVSRCIGALINQLPDDQQRAVRLYELEGIPQATIAERESISLSAVKSRIQRGRKKLESILLDCCRFQFDSRGNVLEYQRQVHTCEPNCDNDVPCQKGE